MIKRRRFVASALAVSGLAVAGAMVPGYRWRVVAQQVLDPYPSPLAPADTSFAQPEPWARKLVVAAEDQIGRTVRYDPSYVGLAYPGGDVPIDRGVCTDVIVRAYRDAFGVDLQKLVHEDMRAHFAAYPKTWGLKKPDRNIDHRRVRNLATYFRRIGTEQPVSNDPTAYLPGNIVAQMLPGNLTHMAIVTDRISADRQRSLVAHNIGAGTRLEDTLFSFEITGHFRYRPA